VSSPDANAATHFRVGGRLDRGPAIRSPDALLWFKDRLDTLSFAACSAPTDGLILEFGVASGATINSLATSLALRQRKLYGFDSFCGLPEPWADYQIGHFACDQPSVASNVELVVGLFAETLPQFLASHAGHVALVHIDCDLYSSTRTVLELLTPRIVPGTFIALDEYYIVTEHEQRAFHDWLDAHGRTCRHLARSIEQAVVVME
jgi:hypothetical protein